MSDKLSDHETEAIARYISERGVTRISYMTILPVEPTMRHGLTWGKGKKMVRPIKRRGKR